MEDIEVYREFWFEEATNLATTVDIQMKLPGISPRPQNSARDPGVPAHLWELP